MPSILSEKSGLVLIWRLLCTFMVIFGPLAFGGAAMAHDLRVETGEKTLLEIAKQRRSIRSFTDRSIDREIIENILKAAVLAPSSKGGRPVEFKVSL